MSKSSGTRTTKRRVYELLVAPQPADQTARKFAIVRMIIIILAVMAISVFTSTERTTLGPYLKTLLILSVAVFTVEYVLEVWSATEDERYSRPIAGRIRFALAPWRIIELLTILPPLALLSFGSLLGFEAIPLRLLYVFQLMLVLRLVRIRRAFDLLYRAWRKQWAGLAVIFVGLWFVMLISAILLHLAENRAQPDDFGSIGASMYWAVITLTAVGYGDVVPVTMAGKILASFISIIGISAFALPTGLVIAGFMQAAKELQDETDQAED